MIAVIVNIEAPVSVAPGDHAPIACRRAIERVYLDMVFASRPRTLPMVSATLTNFRDGSHRSVKIVNDGATTILICLIADEILKKLV
jgi:hypothetical protein